MAKVEDESRSNPFEDPTRSPEEMRDKIFEYCEGIRAKAEKLRGKKPREETLRFIRDLKQDAERNLKDPTVLPGAYIPLTNYKASDNLIIKELTKPGGLTIEDRYGYQYRQTILLADLWLRIPPSDSPEAVHLVGKSILPQL